MPSKTADLPEYPGTPLQAKKEIGVGLGAGILILPLFFSWATLPKGYSGLARAGAFAWLLVTLIAAYANAPDATRAPVSGAVGPAPSVSAGQLVEDYNANEIAADQKYKGKHFQITGVVNTIAKDLLGKTYVTLGTGQKFELQHIQAFFDEDRAAEVASLSKNQSLTVTCQIDGKMWNILTSSCVMHR